MTTQEKFNKLMEFWGSDIANHKTVAWINGYLSTHLRNQRDKYEDLYRKLEEIKKLEDWKVDKPANGKILMVNLIYEQFKKDGLI